jgi:hypothetical protein
MAEDQTTKNLPTTVAELVELISRERAALEQAVAGMSDDAFVATAGGWSAKDHLAHVAVWERRLVGELQGDPAAERFGYDEAALDALSLDDLNAALIARHRDDSPPAVHAEFRASGEALFAALAALRDDDLSRPVRPDDPNVDTLVELIGWDTFEHYPEHVAAIAGGA